MTDKLDTSKEPSKGAWSAALALQSATFSGVQAEQERHTAKIIDRETKAGEMADLLRECLPLAKLLNDHAAGKGNRLGERAERLLTDLEVKP